MPLLEEVAFFMIWFDPDLPVLCIHLNNSGPTARLTARRYCARIEPGSFVLVIKFSTHYFGSLLFRNDPTLIGKIYGLFLGTFVSKDKEKSKNNPKPEHRRVPANTRLRLKLMPHLLKSREAALQVSQDSRQSF